MKVAVLPIFLAAAIPFAWTAQTTADKQAAPRKTPAKPPAVSSKQAGKAPAKSGASKGAVSTGAPKASASKVPASKAPASKAPVSKGAAAKAPASKGTAPKARASKGAASAGKAGAKKSAGKKYAAQRPTRVVQQQPAQDRYKQIEESLAQRGYLKSEPSGKWGTDSQDALKRFQQDQNLSPTGKIDSLSLIALGLGPKRTATAERTAAPPKAQP